LNIMGSWRYGCQNMHPPKNLQKMMLMYNDADMLTQHPHKILVCFVTTAVPWFQCWFWSGFNWITSESASGWWRDSKNVVHIMSAYILFYEYTYVYIYTQYICV
jgi:hypothetical protein